METIYLAAALTLCTQHHVDCRGMDSLQFELKVNTEHADGFPFSVGTAALGKEAWRVATIMCQQVINLRSGSVRIDKTIQPVPMYLYKMYDGAWGTDFDCIREKLIS